MKKNKKMTNEEKAKEITAKYCEYYDGSKEAESTSYNSAMEMAKYKDNQPISELGGWQTEPPTETGLYLGDKGFEDEDSYRYIVVHWYCSLKKFCLPSKVFYQKIKRWKKI